MTRSLHAERIARKRHTCGWDCGHPIEPGTRYVRSSLPPWTDPNETGTWWTHALHGASRHECPPPVTPGGPDMTDLDQARTALEAAGYVVLRAKSYRQAQERLRIAECYRKAAEDRAETAERWARGCLAEERRLRERLTFVYGVALQHGAAVADLRGSTVEDLLAMRLEADINGPREDPT